MKSLRFALISALVASAAYAQPPAHHADQTAPDEMKPLEMKPASVTKWLTFFDKLVDTVVADQDSCEQMATDVRTVIETNRDSLQIARSARDRHEKLPEAAQMHMLEGVRRMEVGIDNCGSNDRVKDAFAKLEVADDE
ncbi:MAG TPA: hypothetical protein VGF94_27275 [Kofleriaceae bacterium]|jgi:hypothetical protein